MQFHSTYLLIRSMSKSGSACVFAFYTARFVVPPPSRSDSTRVTATSAAAAGVTTSPATLACTHTCCRSCTATLTISRAVSAWTVKLTALSLAARCFSQPPVCWLKGGARCVL